MNNLTGQVRKKLIRPNKYSQQKKTLCKKSIIECLSGKIRVEGVKAICSRSRQARRFLPSCHIIELTIFPAWLDEWKSCRLEYWGCNKNKNKNIFSSMTPRSRKKTIK
jgi:hypothetical protein